MTLTSSSSFAQQRASNVVVVVALLLGLNSAGQLDGKEQILAEDREPAERYDVRVGDQSVTLQLNQEGNVKIGDENKPVRIEKSPVKTLRVRKLSFDYPSGFFFNAKVADSPEEFSKWDLKGRWVKLSLQRMPNSVAFADYAATMRDEIAATDGSRKILSESGIVETFGGRKVPGTEYKILVTPDSRVTVQYFDLIEDEEGWRYVLVLAHPPGDGDKELKDVKRLLQASLKFISTADTRQQ